MTGTGRAVLLPRRERSFKSAMVTEMIRQRDLVSRLTVDDA